MDEFVHGPRNDWTCRCGERFPCAGWAEQQSDLDPLGQWATLVTYARDAPRDVVERMRGIFWR